MNLTLNPPTPSNPHRRRVTLAGWVQDALTQERLAGAMITIRQAPDAFIQKLLTKVRILGLPKRWGQWRSPPLVPFSTAGPTAIQDFQTQLLNAQTTSTAILRHLDQIIARSDLNNADKFLALQCFLDTLSMEDWHSQKMNYGRSQSRRDGSFYFTNLPSGFYQLEASLPRAGLRYGQSRFEAELKDEYFTRDPPKKSGFSDILKLKIELPPTTIFGQVIDAKNQEPLEMATVRCVEHPAQTLTSRNLDHNQAQKWNYRLVGVEPFLPAVTLIISASGYAPQHQRVVLQPGESKQCDIQLVAQI